MKKRISKKISKIRNLALFCGVETCEKSRFWIPVSYIPEENVKRFKAGYDVRPVTCASLSGRKDWETLNLYLFLSKFFTSLGHNANRCVAGGCDNVPDKKKGISLHQFPEESDKKRRTQWISFVCTKRAKWSPTKYSCLCSEHFS